MGPAMHQGGGTHADAGDPSPAPWGGGAAGGGDSGSGSGAGPGAAWDAHVPPLQLRRRRLATRPIRRQPTPRPNDPCPCGSGRKWKRCCGLRRQTPRP